MQLERKIYNFSEEEGNAEVCAQVIMPNINTPVDFPFSIQMTTTDDTASKSFTVKHHLY